MSAIPKPRIESPKELHRLVVEDRRSRPRVRATVREGVLEQAAITEAMLDGPLERLELRAE